MGFLVVICHGAKQAFIINVCPAKVLCRVYEHMGFCRGEA